MVVLVVGGAGYIGSHTARCLRAHGFDVIVYDNLPTGHAANVQDFELVIGDIADCQKLSSVLRRVDAILHFAAHAYVGESVANPRKYFDNNIATALVLLNAAVDGAVRLFVFSSTCAVYGKSFRGEFCSTTRPNFAGCVTPKGLVLNLISPSGGREVISCWDVVKRLFALPIKAERMRCQRVLEPTFNAARR